MKHRIVRALGILVFMTAVTACSTQQTSQLTPAATDRTLSSAKSLDNSAATERASCDGFEQPGDDVRCFAHQRLDVGDAAATYFPGKSTGTATIAGFGPADLRSAYNLPSLTAGAGQIVAIVDAYDDPNAETDMGTYRTHFGLPACTTKNGCFQKLNESGQQTKYPKGSTSWGQEISLDLDMVSAICPNCKIILVEASAATLSDLGTSVNTAVAKGANAVSNSYGGSEVNASNAAYNHAGHAIVASAGDAGTGPQQPASYSTVVAVGGTSLSHAATTRGWNETAWSLTGSGCSALVAKPAWQTDAGCNTRSEADVAAVADPYTGVAVYDSYGSRGQVGWLVFGGTSVSSPIIASVYALAGNAASQNAAQGIWNDAGAHLFDVTSGSNGTCSIVYICNAGAGYDGPTGWGTPNGTTAF